MFPVRYLAILSLPEKIVFGLGSTERRHPGNVALFSTSENYGHVYYPCSIFPNYTLVAASRLVRNLTPASHGLSGVENSYREKRLFISRATSESAGTFDRREIHRNP